MHRARRLTPARWWQLLLLCGFGFSLLPGLAAQEAAAGQGSPGIGNATDVSPKTVDRLPDGTPLVMTLVGQAGSASPGNTNGARIVGGRPAEAGRYPYMTYLFGSGFLCGATLIAPDVILTAGHCTDFIKAFVGIYDVNNPSFTSFEEHWVEDDVPHPLFTFDSVPDYDYRLLRLATRSSATPVILDDGSASESLVKGDIFSVLGWGSTVADPAAPAKASSVLLEVRVGYVPSTDELCAEPNGDLMSEAMFCAYEAGQDACKGDSGGPLLLRGSDAEEDIQIGVVSWGQGCAEPGYPGIYSNISLVIDWIDSELEEWGTTRRKPAGPAPPPPPPPPESPASSRCCSDMPWFHDRGGSHRICATTNFRKGAEERGMPCTYAVTKGAAAELCADVGARLCTISEIQAGEVLNAGCVVNFRQVWSSTPCYSGEVDNGYYTAYGTGWGAQCQAAEAATAMTACCADACLTET